MQLVLGACWFSTGMPGMYRYTGPGNDATASEGKSLRSSESLGECTDVPGISG